ncbi:hypothetical protein OGZ02_15715 [Brachyspira hyodysenteriae]|nr:hypothetical protein [Brachyspira hyodysenteriae]MDA1470224.1 hypothetical protein [Brachyspira hyodysenteriae]
MKIKVLETKKFLHGIDTMEDLEFVQNYLRNFAESELKNENIYK